MSLPDWGWAVAASVVGALIVAGIGWMIGFRNLRRRVDDLEDEVEELDDVVLAFIEAMPEDVSSKVLLETWRMRRTRLR